MFRILLVCVVVLISLVASAPVQDESQAKVIKYENNVDEKGNYEFSFETSNGILRYESGTLMNKGEPDEYFSVYGEITYSDLDGTIHKIRYQADKNGYEILPPPVTSVVASLSTQVVATMLG